MEGNSGRCVCFREQVNCLYRSCYLPCAVDCVLPHVFIPASQSVALSEGRIWFNNPKHVASGTPHGVLQREY